ncbi:type VI secretion system lipoprotein TssJ [Budviciaceae bacterium CWB-B4]|uniref:Type VI secretion system lipoprotein TssJ n=1 Tax=Limnobaculum xujianqingii TaxID=2738837 RepID=A0A9D7FRJ2_9GAMM|nr:type VI secretion system lipoprotein TssJ [Limnobaculum xujianqingii]MBK5072165.1 type VI secretion system lipoprotein TssJ [Limnobaculum xujianqingii]MBK5175474.1 type VI secretion system lipoprotein TssJ [Limnobaculum xujianqingii]
MKLIGAVILIFISLMLSGCEVSKKVYTVVTDPDVPVGYPDQNPSEIEFTLLADKNINPNLEGEASPTDIQVIYLEDDSKLLSTDYYQVATEPLDKILGKNYIDHQDYTLEPGQFKPLKSMKIEAKTQFLAVIAHYTGSDTGEVYWMDIVDIDGVGQKYKILIHLRAGEVEIKKS